MSSALPRRIRLVTGMVIFAYVASHLLNLALGLHSLELMDAWRRPILAPWHNPVGQFLLYGSLLAHVAFGLEALYRRRTLRLTRFDAIQLLMALALPPLMVMHVLGTRGAFATTGFESTYAWLMLVFWKLSPVNGLRQVAVVVAAWIHGCMGLYQWMRLQRWWSRASGLLYPVAFLVPVLALLGFVEAGKEALVLAGDPAWLARAEAGTERLDDEVRAGFQRTQMIFVLGYLAVLGLVLLARRWRLRGGGRAATVEVEYLGGPIVRAPAGLTLLELSRLHGLPHTNLCGGRGRCGTCRVRVLRGGDDLAPAAPLEAATLAGLGQGDDVRLACQAVPVAGALLQVERLVPSDLTQADGSPGEAPGSAREVVVLTATMRVAPELAAEHPARAAPGLAKRFLAVVGEEVEAAGGQVERVDGEGARALFGLDTPGADAARAAVRAARRIRSRLAEAYAREQAADPRAILTLDAGRVLLTELECGATRTPGALGAPVSSAQALRLAFPELSPDEERCPIVVSRAVVALAGLAEVGLVPPAGGPVAAALLASGPSPVEAEAGA